MHILVTNDDGVYAPGLMALASALRAAGDVTIVAPRDNQSSMGHRITLHDPLRVDEVTLADGSTALATTGSPADCVSLSMLGLVKRDIDMVVSGINNTWNLGQDVTYSGTVTAAMEAVMFGIPAIAVSAFFDGPERYEVGAAFAVQLAPQVVQHGLPRHTLLNVNVPDLPQSEIQGVMVTRLGTRIYQNKLEERTDPRGRPYYWIGGDAPTGVADEEGTDFWALSQGYVSVTPVHLDMTAHTFTDELREWELGVGAPLEG